MVERSLEESDGSLDDAFELVLGGAIRAVESVPQPTTLLIAIDGRPRDELKLGSGSND